RHHDVDLVVPGRGDHHVALLDPGLLQRGHLTRVAEHPVRLLDRLRFELTRLPLDEHDLVPAVDELRGDGPAHRARARDRDPHQLSSSGARAATLVTSVTVPDFAATYTRSSACSTVLESG